MFKKNLQNKIIKKRGNKKKGFSLVEILLSVSIFALVVMGTLQAIVYAEKAQLNSGTTNQQTKVLEQTLEIVQSLHDDIFIENTDCSNICALKKNELTGEWSLVPGLTIPELYDSESGFLRAVTIIPSESDPNNVKQIIAIVVPFENGIISFPRLKNLTTYISNWKGVAPLFNLAASMQQIQKLMDAFHTENGFYEFNDSEIAIITTIQNNLGQDETFVISSCSDYYMIATAVPNISPTIYYMVDSLGFDGMYSDSGNPPVPSGCYN